MARIVVTTTGSGGDLFPFIPVAEELRRRGHDVVVAAPPALLHLVGASAGDMAAIGPFVARQAVRRHHAFDHRWWGYRGFDGFWQLQLEGLARTTADLRPIVSDADLVLSHVFHPAAVIAADAERTPLVTLNLHPAFQPDARRPPPGVPSTGVGNRLAWRALRAVWRRRVDPGINAVRAEHGLAALDDAALLGAVTGRRSLDLVGSWYAARDGHPTPATPAVGYPIWEPPLGPPDAAVPPGDEPLVVVTLGTALPLDPGSFYDHVLGALADLPVRAVVLGSGLDAVPTPLDGRVALLPFAPLTPMLAQASVVVHHGGTGTSHVAVASDCPSVVVPRCFDQRYQAARLEAVGAGRSVAWRRLTPERLAAAIRAVLSDRAYADAAAALGAQHRAAVAPEVLIAEAIHTHELAT